MSAITDLREQYPEAFEAFKDVPSSYAKLFKEKSGGSEICPFCHASSRHIIHSILDPLNPYWHSGRIHFENTWHFSKDMLAYCTLHATERLVELFIIRTCKNEEMAKQWVVEFFRGLTSKRGKDLAKKHGVPYRVPKGDHPGPINIEVFTKAKFDSEDYSQDSMMIPWKECKLILQTSNFWIPELNELMLSKMEILSERFQIIQYLKEKKIEYNEHESLKELELKVKKSRKYISSEEIKVWETYTKVWDLIHASSLEVESFAEDNFVEQVHKSLSVISITNNH